MDAATRVIHAVHDRGEVFLTPTVLFDKPGVRATFFNWRATECGLEIVWQARRSAI